MNNSRLGTFPTRLTLCWWLALVALGGLNTRGQESAVTLTLNQARENRIVAPEKHLYQIQAQSGQFLQVWVRQLGMNVAVTLFDPNGAEIQTSDLALARAGAEWLSWKAELSGLYRIEVQGITNGYGRAGKYTISVTAQRTFSPTDQTLLSAHAILVKAARKNKDSLYAEAQTLFMEALSLYTDADHAPEAAVCHANLGRVAQIQKQFVAAITEYGQALAFYRARQDGYGQRQMLIQIGLCHGSLAQHTREIEVFHEALAVSVDDPVHQLEALIRLGSAYLASSNDPAIITVSEQAEKLAGETREPLYEAAAIGNQAIYYNFTTRLDKALACHQRSVALYRREKNRRGQVVALLNMFAVLRAQGRLSEGRANLEEALAVADAALADHEFGLEDPKIGVLANLARIAFLTGNNELAWKYHQQALDFAHSLRSGEEVLLLNGSAKFYLAAGRYQAAQQALEKAAALLQAQEEPDPSDRALLLHTLGDTQRHLGNYEPAQQNLTQALTIFQEIGELERQSETWQSLALLALERNQNGLAATNLEQALDLSRLGGVQDLEAPILANLMRLQVTLGNSAVAIFYGKQAINTYQLLGLNLQLLEREAREGFAHRHEDDYRYLADLLLKAKRYLEAEQVLALLKAKEHESLNRSATLKYAVGYSASEALALSSINEHTALAKELRTLQDDLAAKRLVPTGLQRLAQLETATTQARVVIRQSLTALGQTGAATQAAGELPSNPLSPQPLPPGTVALYTLVNREQGHILLVKGNVRTTFPLPTQNLAATVLEFRAALKNRSENYLGLAQELYRTMFLQKNENGRTLAATLTQLRATRLSWSLDGVLRYVPLNALYDGNQFLVERYENSLQAPPATGFRRAPPVPSLANSLQIVGFGVSQKYADFPALANVPRELELLITDRQQNTKGLLPGVIQLNERFTKETFLHNIQSGQFRIAHLATHFSFQPAEEAGSFLLLGDGSHLTLAELQLYPGLFAKLDLLTLAACDSALGGNGNGRSAEGLAYLAQTLGAPAVIASLLPVDDSSAAELLREFYRLQLVQPHLSKAKNLRQAALSLLRHPPTRHPYFWAGYVLFSQGN